MSTAPQRSTLDGVPKQFINSLRVLFDILDEEQTGFVRLSDIETRWKDDNVNGLPKGVVEALRKVTPTNGRLTFERFVAGLKISLLRTKVTEEPSRKPTSDKAHSSGTRPDFPDLLSHGPPPPPHSNSAGYNSQLGGHGNQGGGYYPGQGNQDMRASHRSTQSQHDIGPPQGQRGAQYGPTTATVRPNNAMALGQQRTKSMPVLGQSGGRSRSPQSGGHGGGSYDLGHAANGMGVPVTPAHDPMTQSARQPSLRHEPASAGRLAWSQNGPVTSQAGKSKDEIVNALKKWQRDRMHVGDVTGDVMGQGADIHHNHGNRGGPAAGPIDKRPLSIASTSAFEHFGREPFLQSDDDPLSSVANRKAARRKESRRHTLANGIDYNMIKRMKQLEQEKDVLIQGLEAVEKAREWYLAQIRAVQDKQKYVGKSSGHNDYSVEAHQERMNFQHARISEVNQQLKALVDSSEKGFPLHMNLALSQPVQRPAENTETSNVVAMLKGQNRLLTQEVSEKSDKISQLEREKAALIRDMFDSRSKNRNNNYEDTTFM